MRRCFHCGTRTQADRLKKVGDGEFCDACFQALLRGDPESSGPVAPNPRDVSNPSEITAASAPTRRERDPVAGLRGVVCLVCEREIPIELAIPFLGGVLCPGCNREMVAELRQQTAPVTEAASSDADALIRGGDTDSSREDARSAEQGGSAIYTPGSETRWCASCGRPMPGPGSYRIIDAEAYCPECSASNWRPAAGTIQARRATAVEPVHAAEDAVCDCDCCGRSLALGCTLHSGFRLCEACVGSDVELAVHVARLRHRRNLAQLSATLDSEKVPR